MLAPEEAARLHEKRSVMKQAVLIVAATFCASASAIVVGSTHASAQTYLAKPVRVIVPFPPGGNSDRIARLLGQKLTEAWRQSVIVENRPGAGGSLGSDVAAKAAPDGYTLLIGTFGSIGASAGLYKNLPYDPIKDFAPITLIATPPLLLVVHPSLPVKSVKDLIALGKSRPKQLTYASSGNGSSNHLFGELFESLAGVELVHVPYKGSAPALTDVIAGRVLLMFAPLSAALPHVRAGKLNAVAVSGTKRSPILPDVPTVAESGVKAYQATGWDGVLAPAGTPAAVIAKLNTDIVKVLQTPEMKKQLADEGAEVIGSSPEQFGAFIKLEVSRWSKLIKDLGVTID